LTKETDTIGKILIELRKISVSPFPAPITDGRLELPSWISAGGDETLIINSSINGFIAELSRSLYDADPSLAKSISVQDYAGVIKRVIGPLLGAIDLDDPFEASSETVLTLLRDELIQTN
jgi:hypothetical protein